MSTLHGQMDFYIGDTIQIDVTMTDFNGQPLNLTGCDIEWKLNGPYGDNVETLSIINGVTSGDIVIADIPGGKIAITVPASRTATYLTGYHRDRLRVFLPDPGFADVVATELVGWILMRADLAPAMVTLHAGSLSVQPPQ